MTRLLNMEHKMILSGKKGGVGSSNWFWKTWANILVKRSLKKQPPERKVSGYWGWGTTFHMPAMVLWILNLMILLS